MQDFRNLHVWQRAHALALLTYRITADFPKDEIFGLRLSMRRASIDIPAMISEGCGKPNDAEFSHCVGAALAVANKLEHYALMARDLEFIAHEIHEKYELEIVGVAKMLGGFKRRLV